MNIIPEKGSPDYFRRKKKWYGIFSLLAFLLVGGIYGIGLILFHNNRSVFTVIAAVSVLPAAKMLIAFLMIAPYHSLEKTEAEQIDRQMKDMQDGAVLYDILLASEQKAMLAGTVVLVKGNVLMFAKERVTPKETENYMRTLLKQYSFSSVKQYTDFGQFMGRLSSLAREKEGGKEKEREDLREKTMRDRIIGQILTYTV